MSNKVRIVVSHLSYDPFHSPQWSKQLQTSGPRQRCRAPCGCGSQTSACTGVCVYFTFSPMLRAYNNLKSPSSASSPASSSVSDASDAALDAGWQSSSMMWMAAPSSAARCLSWRCRTRYSNFGVFSSTSPEEEWKYSEFYYPIWY
jgi:hypothetical protein